jgi:hypothetical protein
MGCELCTNENRDNKDIAFTREGERPIIIKDNAAQNNNDKDLYYSFLEEKLNAKYSIPQKNLDELKAKINNENNQLNSQLDNTSNNNKNEYIINTLNIYSNNTIQFSSRNKNQNQEKNNLENGTDHNKETTADNNNVVERDLNYKKANLKNEKDKEKEKEKEKEINELKNNLRNSKNEKRSRNIHFRSDTNDKGSLNQNHNPNNTLGGNLKEKSSKKKKRKHNHSSNHTNNNNDNDSKDGKDTNKSKHKHKHKTKSSYDKKSKNKEKSRKKNKKKEDNNNFENNEDESGEKDSQPKIKYSYTKQVSRKTEKINSLLKDIRHSKIDRILKDAPKREETSLEKLIKYFKKNSMDLSEVERAWLVFKWITNNIEYDFEGVNAYSYDISEEATFNRGKSICSGYAGLYKKIGDSLDLTVERIGGFSKGFNFNLGETIEDSEKHEWNAVKIDEEWYFIESTWGAGYSTDDKKFTKRFTPYYFFTPPQEFVRGHLPFDAKWQLLPKDKKISQQVFMDFAPLKSDFFTLGFSSIDPDYTFNEVKEKGKIILNFEKHKEIKNHDNLKVMAKLYLVENNESKEIPNSILPIRKDNFFEVNYLINKKGEYKLKIFGNDGTVKEYNELCTLKLTSDKDATSPKEYPSTTGLYFNSDIKIIQPNIGIFKEGDKITFEMKTKTFDQLYIGVKINETNNFTEMNKDNDIFIEEDFLIYGQKILISCKGEKVNSYSTILEYNVIPTTKSKNSIKFPKVFAGPKNKLIEPIIDKLKKGKKIKFELKSNLIEEMAVVDGEEFHTLDKNDDVFTGSVKITANEVKIVYKKEEGYGVLYSYAVI